MPTLPSDATSFWLRDNQTTYPSLTEDIEVDVAIVGAGIAGLTTAYFLTKVGYSVAVVEKDTIGAGVTGHTTGKVTSQHNLIYTKLHKRLGEPAARIYGTANQQALEEIESIIATEHIDCDWEVDDNYVFTTDASRVSSFQEEAAVAAELSLPATFTKKTDLPFDISGAVKFSGQGKLHSHKYLLGLAAAITKRGGHIYEHSKIVSIHESDPSTIRATEATVYAKDIVVATNVPTFPLVARASYALGEYPMQSYIVCGQPSISLYGMYISPDSDHYSILPITIDGEPRLLIGGEGNIPGTRLNFKARHGRLATYGEERFGMGDISHRWYHRDYLGYDDMPLIGPLYPHSKRLFVATGFMKWGLTNGTVAGILLRDIITGTPNEWIGVFHPHRPSLVASIPKVIGEKLGVQ